MSKKNSEQEIEEAHKKVRGEPNSKKKKLDQKADPKDSEDKKEIKGSSEKEGLEKDDLELAEEHNQEKLSEQKQSKEVDLEEIARNTQPLPAEVQGSQYVEQLSHKPMGEIYKEIKDIYKAVEDKGYLSTLEQKQVEYLSSAVQQKFEDEEQGIYSFSEQAARAASITQHLSASMMGSYKGKKMNEMYKN